MKALILAAGLGTRLRPYTLALPKPLFPVGGAPLLARHITTLIQAGATSVAVNTHHLHDQIDAFIKETDWGVPVLVSHESEILGTGGAMKRLVDVWDAAPFLVINADVVCDLDLKTLYQAHLNGPALATLVMHDHAAFNSVAVDDAGRIRMMPPRALTAPPAETRLMAFTGVHVVDTKVLSVIPDGRFYSIIDAYQELLDRGERLAAFLPSGDATKADTFYWRDIGTPDQYRRTAYEQLLPQALAAAFGEGTYAAATTKRTPLAGDGSDRRWYRLATAGRFLILADHGLREQEPPAEADAYTQIGRHLFRRGVAVPQIFMAEPFSGLVFCQDLGNENLQSRGAKLLAEGRCDHLGTLYRQVIAALIDLNIEGAVGFDPAWTYQSPAYDQDLILEKECRYFLEAFIGGYLGWSVDDALLVDELISLANALMAASIPGLVHRDMQSRNVMLHEGRCYFIDFQGARPGPLQYDIASLLVDPYVNLPADLQARLFDDFRAELVSRLDCDSRALERGYRLCRVTRNLQVLGAFAFLSQVKGKPGFAHHIPAAADALVANLNHPEMIPSPRLTELAAKAADAVNAQKAR